MNKLELIEKVKKDKCILNKFSNNFEIMDCRGLHYFVEQKITIHPDLTVKFDNFGTNTVLIKEYINKKLQNCYIYNMDKKYVKYDVIWTAGDFEIKYNTLSSEYTINGKIDYNIEFEN